jgi:hypothetical protein
LQDFGHQRFCQRHDRAARRALPGWRPREVLCSRTGSDSSGTQIPYHHRAPQPLATYITAVRDDLRHGARRGQRSRPNPPLTQPTRPRKGRAQPSSPSSSLNSVAIRTHQLRWQAPGPPLPDCSPAGGRTVRPSPRCEGCVLWTGRPSCWSRLRRPARLAPATCIRGRRGPGLSTSRSSRAG